MQALWQDVRFGVRMLMKNRLVSLVCIIALALGIGANAAIFSMAEAFLIHPVPFENADRYVTLLDRHVQSEGGGFANIDFVPIDPATYFDWKKQAKSFDRITAYQWDEVNLTGDSAPQKIQAMHVASDFFETIGVPAAHENQDPENQHERSANQSNCRSVHNKLLFWLTYRRVTSFPP